MGACFSSTATGGGKGEASESNHKHGGAKLPGPPKSCAGGGSKVSAESSSSSLTSSPPSPTPRRSEGEILQASNLKVFAFNDIKAATRNFRPDSVLGEGGFGSVFKGWIDENSLTAARPGTGTVIAVKRLNLEGLQGHNEWLTEINYLSRLHHPNLVKLLGYCLEDEHRMLVYEFMPKGSLENHLFRRGSHVQPLSWNLRMKIALEAAKGLAFLHNAKPKVIYRDLKSSNILLDSSYNAKLSDFGLAKDGPIGENSHVSTRVMGTYGYAAPEYVATGHLTARSDIYSFGVVLLELLTGRRALDKSRPSSEHSLVDWARPALCHKRRIFRVLDPRLEGQYPLAGAHKAATLALQCVCVEPKFRPGMDEVVGVLEQLQNAKDVARSSQGGGGAGAQRVAGGAQGRVRWSLPEAGHRKVAFRRPEAAAAAAAPAGSPISTARKE